MNHPMDIADIFFAGIIIAGSILFFIYKAVLKGKIKKKRQKEIDSSQLEIIARDRLKFVQKNYKFELVDTHGVLIARGMVLGLESSLRYIKSEHLFIFTLQLPLGIELPEDFYIEKENYRLEDTLENYEPVISLTETFSLKKRELCLTIPLKDIANKSDLIWIMDSAAEALYLLIFNRFLSSSAWGDPVKVLKKILEDKKILTECSPLFRERLLNHFLKSPEAAPMILTYYRTLSSPEVKEDILQALLAQENEKFTEFIWDIFAEHTSGLKKKILHYSAQRVTKTESEALINRLCDLQKKPWEPQIRQALDEAIHTIRRRFKSGPIGGLTLEVETGSQGALSLQNAPPHEAGALSLEKKEQQE